MHGILVESSEPRCLQRGHSVQHGDAPTDLPDRPPAPGELIKGARVHGHGLASVRQPPSGGHLSGDNVPIAPEFSQDRA